MTTDEQFEIAIRHQVMLERLKSGAAKDLRKAVQKVELAMQDILRELRVDSVSDLGRTELRKVLSQLRRLQVEIMAESLRQQVEAFDKVAEGESKFEAAALNRQIKGQNPFKPSTAKKAQQAWRQNPMSANGQLFEDFFKDYSNRQLREAQGVIRRAHSEGWTIGEAVRAYRVTRAGRFRDGVAEVSKRHAEAVVRTGYQHLSQQVRNQTWLDNDDIVEGYRWVSTLASRTTQVCRSLDGQVFKLGEGPQPPIHISCRSTTIAEMPDFLDFLDKDATRSAENGPVDADLTYYEWLKKQPLPFQEEAIGKTRAALLNSGDLTADEFARLNLGRNFEPLTLDEMEAKRPELFENLNTSPRD